MNRDTTPTIVPPRDAELALFERVAAQHPTESPYVPFRRAVGRAVTLAVRNALRNRYASRGNALAMRCVAEGRLP